MSGCTPRLLVVASSLAALLACQAPSSRVKAPEPAPPAAPLDPSFDWHALVVAPFGSVLKAMPLALHEVLLFKDRDPGAGTPDEGECYATDAGAPRFLARAPAEYLLCFKQDRLSRIHASVRMAETEAPALFAAACAGWLKNAAATGAAASAPAQAQVQAQDIAVAAADACEGRDGAVHFNAGLEVQAESTVFITLDSASDP